METLSSNQEPPKLVVRKADPLVPPSDDVYDTTTDPPGEVLILSYDKIGELDKSSAGSVSDFTSLQDLFTKMGYGVEGHCNLGKMATLRAIESFSQNERLSRTGCTIVIVLSHGDDRQTFLTSDEKVLTTRTVMDYFLEDKCEHLMGKPKIFLFQMCRGEYLPRESDSVDATCEFRTPPRNMLVLYSTTEGFVSFRDKILGSPFVNAFCEVVAQDACELSLNEILRKVQKKYNVEGLGAVMDKQDFHFMKRFYFNPRGHLT